MKNTINCFLSLVLIALMLYSLCSCENNRYEPNTTELNVSGIELKDFYPYSGEYFEDGSDEQVSNVAAIRIFNNTKKAWQLLKLEIMANGEKYYFSVTAFMPGMTLTVFEENRKKLDFSAKETYMSIIESGEFSNIPQKHEEIFSTDIYNGLMNLRNNSNKDIKSNIYVYYKNTDRNGYVGGITYRINFGKMKRGELSQRSSSHLKKGKSEILFITYAD